MVNNAIAHGITSQVLASLSMLKDCVERCPEKDWNESHKDQPFSQVVFHALFDCDYNLCNQQDDFMIQLFHEENRGVFAGYEEFEENKPFHFYERAFVTQYYDFCKEKVVSVISAKSYNEMIIPNSDVNKCMTLLE